MKNLAFIFLATLLASEAQAYEVPTNEYNYFRSHGETYVGTVWTMIDGKRVTLPAIAEDDEYDGIRISFEYNDKGGYSIHPRADWNDICYINGEKLVCKNTAQGKQGFNFRGLVKNSWFW
ncbi:hypothetical protein KW429_02440 [Vibrio fluvialis]|nr:hypothetical protein [Vibrio fluvialis]